ncbi:MAG: HAMP domain-containing sensor histidine kinase [Anaeromyxobacter sp.]
MTSGHAAEVERWRERALTVVARIGAAFAALSMTGVTFYLSGNAGALALGWSIVAAMALVALGRGLHYRVRAVTYVATALAGGFAGAVLFSFQVTPIAVAFTAVLYAAVFLGRASALVTASLFMAGLVGLAALPESILVEGLLGVPKAESHDPLLTAMGLLPSIVQTTAAVWLVLGGFEGALGEAGTALAAARASEERLRAVFDASPNAVMLISVPGERFLDVSPGFERVLGWPRSEVIGRTPMEIGIVAGTEPRWAERLDARRDLEAVELDIRRRDGSPLRIALSLRIAEVGGERVAVAIARDVTPQHRLAAGMRRLQRVEALGSLVAGIAHNFRNALGAVLPTLDFCLEEAPPSLRPALSDARDSTSAAVELASDLTRLSRGEAIGTLDRVDVLSIARDVVALAARTFGGRFRVAGTGLEGEVYVRGNASALRHGLLNLCINARDAMAERGGRVEVSAKLLGDRLLLEVRDEGHGMPPEVVRRLGEPFFTTKPEGKGTGLGFATALEAVREAGGRIEVESEPGRGATFHVTLPLAGEAAAAPRPAARNAGKVLVASAEPVMRDVLVRQLEGLQLEGEPAADAAAAGRLLADSAQTYGLVVADAELGLADKIRRLAPHLRLVAIVPSEGTPAPEGAHAVLVRPVGTYDLARAIAEAWELGEGGGPSV